jgi:predicted PhzF superfamily epimerase YddE/YHI9
VARPITQVDAFTAEPFRGNPAAVCMLPAAAPSEWMQAVAREMNLSETAFVHAHEDAFDLRWFTPAVEVDLCGHATLASAHVLWSEGHLPRDREAVFHTRSGVLTCVLEPDPAGDWIRMDFPALPQEPADPPPGLLGALGATPTYLGRNRFDFLVEVESEAEVRALRPDMGRLAEVNVRGVIVTARSAAPEYDFVSRFFGPRVGVPEDPVTGSAHTCLGPFWGARLGKTDLVGYQASARGGVVRVGVRGERVLLGGQAVTVLQGTLVD